MEVPLLLIKVISFISIYSSLYWDSFEHANATNTSAMAFNFVNQNPLKETEFKDRMKDNDYRLFFVRSTHYCIN